MAALQTIMSGAQLDARTCAAALGISPKVFLEWVAGQPPIPESVVPLLAAVLGVSAAALTTADRGARRLGEEDVTPQIWFKFRGPEHVSDREFVLLLRQLGYYLNEVEEVTRKRSLQWKTLFQSIRDAVDPQAPPREQGKAAGRSFRVSTSLGHGATGSGEVLRGLLRSLGVLMVETPMVESRIEGCSFLVGSASAPRPCIFANSHHTTWFRRNMILMHEIAHAIFEQYLGASLDLADADAAMTSSADIEIRAEAFAQETLVPRDVLQHVAQSRGIAWGSITETSLAQLVADIHVEKSVVIRAAVEAGFLGSDQIDELKRLEIDSHLHRLSQHALTTDEFLESTGVDKADWMGKRSTTLASRAVRLPVGYVNIVVDAYRNKQISPGKAAEYLMIDEPEFFTRFGDIYDHAVE